jgi:large subunit ribosomal protein L18
VDDDSLKVLASVSDISLKAKKGQKKSDIAKEVGKLIAKKAKEKKIEKVVFDRAGILFHGRIKALAEGAREEGLKF